MMATNPKNKILLAGSTGYLGSHIATIISEKNLPARFLARNTEKLKKFTASNIEIVQAEVTKPETLSTVCQDIDVVISTVGITRQKDGLTYMDVDYQANLNLLRAAQKAGVRKFIYIAVIDGDKHRHLKICEAKEAFVDELKSSGLEHTIVRPNGFFSDMKEFLDMSKKGNVFLFGNGNQLLNPIHGRDLAEFCLHLVDESVTECTVGGPDVLTHNEIATMAFEANGRKPKIIHLPNWLRKLTLWSLRKFTAVETYGPIEFFLTLMKSDTVAPRFGKQHLKEFYQQHATH